ncbi:class I SAM-dependent methyltransferase [Hamadaea sp. NPDC050747]|uniref:class I SAM-dependent methyltransferase n=1 Tax=Hamadaea sp. NPDC050747 TaxID=3155789 RepID=UPI0033DCE8A6
MWQHRQLGIPPAPAPQRPPFGQLSALLLLDRLVRLRPQPWSLLDVGCGSGELLRLALRFFPGTAMAGVDPAPWLLEQAAVNAQHARLLRGMHSALPLPSASAEIVTCRQHDPAERWVVDLEEARRVLTSDGLLGMAGRATPSPGELVAYGFAIADTQFVPATDSDPGFSVVIARWVGYSPTSVL